MGIIRYRYYVNEKCPGYVGVQARFEEVYVPMYRTMPNLLLQLRKSF